MIFRTCPTPRKFGSLSTVYMYERPWAISDTFANLVIILYTHFSEAHHLFKESLLIFILSELLNSSMKNCLSIRCCWSLTRNRLVHGHCIGFVRIIFSWSEFSIREVTLNSLWRGLPVSAIFSPYEVVWLHDQVDMVDQGRDPTANN